MQSLLNLSTDARASGLSTIGNLSETPSMLLRELFVEYGYTIVSSDKLDQFATEIIVVKNQMKTMLRVDNTNSVYDVKCMLGIS